MSIYKIKAISFNKSRPQRFSGTMLFYLFGFISVIYLSGCNSFQNDKEATSGTIPGIETSALQLPEGFKAVVVAQRRQSKAPGYKQ